MCRCVCGRDGGSDGAGWCGIFIIVIEQSSAKPKNFSPFDLIISEKFSLGVHV